MKNKWEPFDVNGSIFRPRVRLLYVEEPEFGCEGAPEDGEPGTVCEVLLKGYQMEGAVLRHAMVKVVPE